jgi:hypothetical protein
MEEENPDDSDVIEGMNDVNNHSDSDEEDNKPNNTAARLKAD